MRIRFHARTDPGLRRTTNEDAFAASEADGFCVLCDGMGGHASGEVASRLAVQVLSNRARVAIPRPAKNGAPRPPREVERLRDLLPALVGEWIRDANAAVFQRGLEPPAAAERAVAVEPGRHMGTTIALLCVVDDFAVAAHIGDSRIYLWRGGELRLLTRDHSVLSKDLGSHAGREPLPPPAAGVRRKRKYVTRALGTREEARPELQTIQVAAGDRFILCSDGLTDLVGDADLGVALDTAGDRWDAVPSILIDLANARGGRDNITVIVAEVGPDERAARKSARLKAPLPMPVVPVGIPMAFDDSEIEDLDLLIDDDETEEEPPPPPPLEPPPAWDPE